MPSGSTVIREELMLCNAPCEFYDEEKNHCSYMYMKGRQV